MASLGYYDDRGAPSSYRYGGGGGYARQSTADGAGTSFHLFIFLATASLLGAASLYSRCESAVESLFDQVRVVVVLSPLLLLLAMQYWAAAAGGGGRRSGLSSLLMAPLVGEHSGGGGGGGWYDQRRDGSSPWGVALALALVLLLISYQSCFQDWWFPLVNRRR
uniref:Uncharacterized protein n=1 Tax=Oryza meridionalis TaxID=40149 RepID=A0A0E0CS55_9ORYZ